MLRGVWMYSIYITNKVTVIVQDEKEQLMTKLKEMDQQAIDLRVSNIIILIIVTNDYNTTVQLCTYTCCVFYATLQKATYYVL